MARKSISIDLDDTLNCLDKAWIAEYNKRYNDNLDLNDIKSWDISSYVKPECGKNIYKILATPGFFRNLDVKDHAQEVVEWLNNHYEVYILSAAHFAVCGDKGAWLQKYFPFIPYQNIIFCNNKKLVHTDYLIDDGAHNLEGFTGTKLLFDAHHNKYENRFIRLNDWLDVKEYFRNELIRG